RGGKVVRQVKLADRDLYVDAKIVLPAQNFEDTATRVLRGSGPVCDFDVDHHAFKVVPVRMAGGFIAQHTIYGFSLRPLCFGFLTKHRGHRGVTGVFHSWRDDDFLRDLAVHRFHIIVAAAVVEDPNHGGMPTYHGTHDAPFSAAIWPRGDDIDQYTIAMHGIADGVRGYENISHQTRLHRRTQRARIGNDKAETVAVHGEASSDKILVSCRLRQSVAVGIELNQ